MPSLFPKKVRRFFGSSKSTKTADEKSLLLSKKPECAPGKEQPPLMTVGGTSGYNATDDVEKGQTAEGTTPLSTTDKVLGDEVLEVVGASNDATESTHCWSRYNVLVEQHPLLVKSITAFFILGSGDLCGQGIEHIRANMMAIAVSTSAGVDWPRAARFAAFGFFGAPWSHYYFAYLDKMLPPTEQPFTKTTFLKVGIDQFVQAPILLAFMISTLSILKGEGWAGVVVDMKANYWESLLANCTCSFELI